MVITSAISIDMQHRYVNTYVDAVQYDVNSRKVEITLLSAGSRVNVPAGSTFEVKFQRPDGGSGSYSELSDGQAAVTQKESNIIVVWLSEFILSEAGTTVVSVCIKNDETEVNTFSFNVNVQKSPYIGTGLAKKYPNTYDATATSADIANGKTAYVNGEKVLGTAQDVGFDIPVTKNLNMNGFSILDAGRLEIAGNGTDPDGGVYVECAGAINEGEAASGQILGIYGSNGDEPVVLRNIHDPVEEQDVATKHYVDQYGGSTTITLRYGVSSTPSMNTVTGWQDTIPQMSETYPYLWIEITTETKTATGGSSTIEAGIIGYYSTDSGGNAALTTAQIEALHGMFKVCAFTKDDVSAEYAAFRTAFGIEDSGEEEPDTPVEPDEPEVTLTSISATYSGGEVAVGTAVTALTGIVVTAHYSDGTSETVTEYTMSGTIAEGSNTVTVSYGGKTTTFSVTGIAESGGEDSGADTSWTANEAYTNFNWTDGKMINTGNGAEGNMSTFSASDYMPCAGASTLTSSLQIEYAAFYDSSKAFVSAYRANAEADVEVPENAAYFRISGVTETIKTITLIPDKSYEGAGTDWSDGVAYTDFGWTDGYYISGKGTPASYNGFSVSDFMQCNGASTIQFVKTSSGNIDYTAFYDPTKTMVEGSQFRIKGSSETNEIAVPDGAAYFRFTAGTDDKASYSVTPHA